MVVSAAGNFGKDGLFTIASPGNAHKALAIGAMHVVTAGIEDYSSRGPTSDHRIKPDLVAPTKTTIASTASNTAMYTPGGTSFSGPYAAGAAALARNWIRGSNVEIDPGQINAFLIMSGNQPVFDNDWGAGLLVMPVNGHVWLGSVAVSQGTAVNLPLTPVGNPTSAIDAAIWWPETPSQLHSRVSLKLLRPSATAIVSNASHSVFQKVRLSPVTNFSGTYTLRITGEIVAGVQTVYWAAFRYY